MKVGSLRFALSRRCGMLCAPPDAPFQSEPIKIHWGRRYRLAFVNKSDDMHPLHLHRHNFEITKIHGKETSGIFKDTVLITRRKLIHGCM
jgi:FtsP/CotA-like multicopper oxidase with cupredoxin domain